jgi:DHA1 family bicyclomycin/chloramphenicol resistance-like MFS transporter
MVISRAIIRDLYRRERISSMISLVIAVMMIAQMLSPLTGGLLETTFGWRSIFYVTSAGSLAVAVAIALALPETRRVRLQPSGFRGDVGSLLTSRAFIGYVLCQVLASQIIFTFAGGAPYIVITHMGRTGAEYGAWFALIGFAYLVGNLFCVRFAPRHSLEKLIWFGLALQLLGSLLNLVCGLTGLNQMPAWLFGTQMIVMFANAFVMSNSAAGAISVRPEAAGTASGAMGFLQMGLGSFLSQFGAYLGGHFTTPAPLNAAVFVLSLACASTMVFIIPRRDVVVSEELIEQAEEETGMVCGWRFTSPRNAGRGRRRREAAAPGEGPSEIAHTTPLSQIRRSGLESAPPLTPTLLPAMRGEGALPHSPTIFSHSSSVSTVTPCFFASASFEPAPGPATT